MITYHFYKLIKSNSFHTFAPCQLNCYIEHVLACIFSPTIFSSLRQMESDKKCGSFEWRTENMRCKCKMSRHRENAANLFDWICMRVSACTFLRIVYNWFWNGKVAVGFFRAPILLKHLFKYHDKHVRKKAEPIAVHSIHAFKGFNWPNYTKHSFIYSLC